MTEKSKRVDYEMKYIGWNMGATRVERHETKGDIELLELTIDGVDVLKQLEKAEKWDLADKFGPPPHGDKRIQWHIDMSKLRLKLEAVKKWYGKWGHHINNNARLVLEEILEAET